jgi:hypothetical protein
VLAACCAGFTWINGVGNEQYRRGFGEVTTVQDADDAERVLVEVKRSGYATSWAVDDTGAAHSTNGDATPTPPRTEDCAGRTCYRVAGDTLRVEASEDGGASYTVAWQIDGDTYQMLARGYPDLGDPKVHLSSRSVVVHPTTGGHVVFVANGRDGLLFRNEEGGWQRLGFPDSGEGCCFFTPPIRIPSEPKPVDVTWFGVAFVVLATLVSGAIALIFARPRRYRRLLAVGALAVLAGYGTYQAGHFPPVGMFPGIFYGIMVFLATYICSVLLAVRFVRGPKAPRSTSMATQSIDRPKSSDMRFGP